MYVHPYSGICKFRVQENILVEQALANLLHALLLKLEPYAYNPCIN